MSSCCFLCYSHWRLIVMGYIILGIALQMLFNILSASKISKLFSKLNAKMRFWWLMIKKLISLWWIVIHVILYWVTNTCRWSCWQAKYHLKVVSTQAWRHQINFCIDIFQLTDLTHRWGGGSVFQSINVKWIAKQVRS